MPTIEKLSIALPQEMAAMIRSAVDRGEYSSNSEVVRDALRDWTYKRSLRERDDSEGLDPDPVFDRLERKYAPAKSGAAKRKKAR
jgi:antitoxin ParD1/3/4